LFTACDKLHHRGGDYRAAANHYFTLICYRADMMNETGNKNSLLAAITVGLLLFFGAVSFTVSSFAVQTGLLADNGHAATTLAALLTK
jgi:hypothetical protein